MFTGQGVGPCTLGKAWLEFRAAGPWYKPWSLGGYAVPSITSRISMSGRNVMAECLHLRYLKLSRMLPITTDWQISNNNNNNNNHNQPTNQTNKLWPLWCRTPKGLIPGKIRSDAMIVSDAWLMLEINNPALKPEVFQRSVDLVNSQWLLVASLKSITIINRRVYSTKKHIEESNPQTVGKWRVHPFSDGSSYTKKKMTPETPETPRV